MTEEHDDIERLLTRYRPAGPPARLRRAVLQGVPSRLWPLAAAAAALWLLTGLVYTWTAGLQPDLPARLAAHESLAQWLGGRPDDYAVAERLLATFEQDARVGELRDPASSRTDRAWSEEATR